MSATRVARTRRAAAAPTPSNRFRAVMAASLILGASGGATIPASASTSPAPAGAHAVAAPPAPPSPSSPATEGAPAALAGSGLLLPNWSKTGPESLFGVGVKSAGDVNGDGYSDALVASPWYSNAPNLEGAVFLYYGSANGLVAVSGWHFETNQSGCSLAEVSTVGDVNADGYDDFVIGAPLFDGGQVNEGRVWVFLGGAGGPTLHGTLEVDEAGAWFGESVSWCGDVNGDGYDDILVGAKYWGGYGSPFYIPVQGRAYVYFGGPGGPDTSYDWSRAGGQEDMDYGDCVAGLGDINGDGYDDILVGGPRWDSGVIDSQNGTARCYLGSPTGPATSPHYEWYGGANDRLGESVCGGGDVNGDGFADAIVCAPHPGGTAKIYQCLGSASGIAAVTAVSNPGDAVLDASPVGDFNGDGFADVLVGTDADEIHLLEGGPGGLTHARSRIGDPGSGFGMAVGGLGDVNGDGFADMIAGAPWDSTASAWYGRRMTGMTVELLGITEGFAANGHLGAAAASAGDVNGDGRDDVIGGSPQADRADLWFGSPDGIGGAPDWTAHGGESFGLAVASAGDVNGDGFADVAVGEPDANAVHVFHGSASGPSATPDWTYTLTGDANALFGLGVASAGDVNGDGYGDLVVGGPFFDGAVPDGGCVRVFLGSASGLASTHLKQWFGNGTGAQFGATVANAGDINGDGFDDLAAGSPYWDTGSYTDAGAVSVFFANGAGYDSTAWFAIGQGNGANLGYSIAGGGDVNGDGFADIVMGEPGRELGAGRVRVYVGSPTGYVFDKLLGGPAGATGYGLSVDQIGDVNLDGPSDVIVGHEDDGQTWVEVLYRTPSNWYWYGRVFHTEPPNGVVVATAGDFTGDGFSEILFGLPYARLDDAGRLAITGINERDPVLPTLSARAHTGGGTPVALRGRLPDPADLAFSLDGWSPMGRTDVRAECRVALVGQAFTPVAAGPWADTGAPGSVTTVTVPAGTPLTDGARYRWKARLASSNPFHPRGRWLVDEPGAPTLYALTTASSATSVIAASDALPGMLRFERVGPNPFRNAVDAVFALPRSGPVDARVLDVSGRVVADLAGGLHPAGRHALRWDGRTTGGATAAAGVYFLRVDTVDGAVARKVVRLP